MQDRQINPELLEHDDLLDKTSLYPQKLKSVIDEKSEAAGFFFHFGVGINDRIGKFDKILIEH